MWAECMRLECTLTLWGITQTLTFPSTMSNLVTYTELKPTLKKRRGSRGRSYERRRLRRRGYRLLGMFRTRSSLNPRAAPFEVWQWGRSEQSSGKGKGISRESLAQAKAKRDENFRIAAQQIEELGPVAYFDKKEKAASEARKTAEREEFEAMIASRKKTAVKKKQKKPKAKIVRDLFAEDDDQVD